MPFVPPEQFERRLGRTLKLRIGANESAFGPSPKAVAAIREGATRVAWYCDPEGFVLREALARHHGVKIENIGLGTGADDILGLSVRSFADAGDPVVMSHGGYATFAFHVAGFGARFVHAPYRDFRNDAEALGAAARASQARLVYLANPGNPTGSWLSADEQMRLIDGLPKGAILVLDEAYSDFAPRGSLPELDPEDPRVIRVRTFSKAHGMAGMRVGYAIAPAAVIATFDKNPPPFRREPLAQEAALASLGDQDFIRERRAQGRGRPRGVSRHRRAAAASHAAVLDQISSPSTWARAPARAPLWRSSSRRNRRSCACRAWRRSTGSCASRSGRTRSARASAKRSSAFCRSFRAEAARVMPPPTRRQDMAETERFKTLTEAEQTQEQKKLVQAIIAGPRKAMRGGPFQAFLRSP